MIHSEPQWIVGVDECSYGSWVGNVWAAAVVLRENIPGLNDSKKLTPAKREALAKSIREKALSYGVGYATAQEIDEIGPLKASHLAMLRAIHKIHIPIGKILVDGNKVPKWGWETEAIIKGDTKIPEIMAASILAKVARTQEMADLAKLHPQYGFDKHQGYGTAEHKAALEKYGALAEHRHSYKPIIEITKEKNKKRFGFNWQNLNI